jgi:hypothetical protein
MKWRFRLKLAGSLFDMAISGYFFHPLKITGNKGSCASVESMTKKDFKARVFVRL